MPDGACLGNRERRADDGAVCASGNQQLNFVRGNTADVRLGHRPTKSRLAPARSFPQSGQHRDRCASRLGARDSIG